MNKKAIVTGLMVAMMAGVAAKPAIPCDEQVTLKDMTKQIRQLLNDKQIEDAVELAQEAVKEYEDSPISHYYSAKAYDAAGNSEKAIEEYEASLELHEENFHALNNVGLLYLRGGMLDEARAVLEIAVEMDGAEDYAFNNLGVTYERLGMKTEAADMYEKAVALNPDYAKAIESLARVTGEKKTEVCSATTGE